MFIGTKESYIEHLFATFKNEQPFHYDLLASVMHLDGMSQLAYQKTHRLTSDKFYKLKSEAVAALKMHLLKHGVSSILDTSI
jgi:hypothetical protein